MKILFWNTHNNVDINSILCDIIVENNVVIVILAEYSANMMELICELSVYGVQMKPYDTVGCERIQILGTIKNIEPHLQTDHTSIQIINNKDVLCCVHLSSKIYSDSEERRKILINNLIYDIVDIENELNTENTIIVGDFNSNPYDMGCLGAPYFHAIPIYEECKKKFRTIERKKFKMFYNPMWNFFGDFKKPYGTYYYSGNNTLNTYWHIYDQVIIRPVFRERFVDESLKIITETKRKSLLNRNRHPDRNISDHLPIIFEIKGEEDE